MVTNTVTTNFYNSGGSKIGVKSTVEFYVYPLPDGTLQVDYTTSAAWAKNVAGPEPGGTISSVASEFGLASGTAFLPGDYSQVTVTSDAHGNGFFSVFYIDHNISVHVNGHSYASASAPSIFQPLTPGTPAAVRDSDSSVTLTWTMFNNTSFPVSNVTVKRSIDGGAYSDIATIGAATTYTDTTTQSGHRYTYSIVVSNSAGTATSGISNEIITNKSAYYNDSGTWKPAEVYARSSGLWVPAVPSVKVGGVWVTTTP